MAKQLLAQIDKLADATPGASLADRRRAAIGIWSAMVGALILARAVDDPVLSNELLAETQAWLHQGNRRALPRECPIRG